MKKNILYGVFVGTFLFIPMNLANQFVKKKPKKEIAVRVKEDIVELLESCLRQICGNIQELVTVQSQIFDKIKEIYEDGQPSTSQLKELRDNLEKNLKTLQTQQADLHNFFLGFP